MVDDTDSAGTPDTGTAAAKAPRKRATAAPTRRAPPST